MTTLCRCDWVETKVDLECRLALAKSGRLPERGPPASMDAAMQCAQETRRLPIVQAAPLFISEYAA